MNKISVPRYVLKKNLIMLVGIFLCIYFSYHLIQGNRSVLRLGQVEHNIATLEAELDALQEKRQALEEKVVMLRPDSLNKDLLEERVRYVLGYKHPDDVSVAQYAVR